MSNTTFSAGTTITSEWLNEVNDSVFDGKDQAGISWINVKDPAYGAIGNGTTDDTAALQAAINAAYGKTLYIPSGTYLTSSQLLINNNITIIGDGYTSVIKGTASGTYIILLAQHATFAAINGVKLSHFRIDGNNGGQLDSGIIQLNNCVDYIVDHVWIENATRSSGSSGVNGIATSLGAIGGTGSRGTIAFNTIRNTSKAAINTSSASVETVIIGNHIRDIAGNGVAPGIQVFGAGASRIIGNYITNTEGAGVYADVDGSGNQPLDLIVSGNVINSCGATSATVGDGVRITASSTYTGRVIVSENSVSSCGTSTNGGSGIYVINTENVLVSSNISRDSAYDGVRIQGCTNGIITNNRLSGNNRAGVSYAGAIQIIGTCNDVSITGNNCSDDKATKTQSYGIITDSAAVLNALTITANHLEGNVNGPLLLNAGAKKMHLEFVGEKQTTDGVAQTAQYIALPDTSAILVTTKVLGKKSDATDRAIYSREGLFYRNGGTATQQGATTTLGTDIESDATWTGPTLAVSGNLVLIQITGKASTTIDWRFPTTVQTL